MIPVTAMTTFLPFVECQKRTVRNGRDSTEAVLIEMCE